MPTVHPAHANGKKCPKCGEFKSPDQFHFKDKAKGRLLSWCKACSKQRYHENPAIFNARSIAWQKRNPEKVKAIRRRTYAKHADKIKEYARGYRKRMCHTDAFKAKKRKSSVEYRVRNADKIKASNARYRAERAVELAERQRKWREAHPDEYREIHGGWKKRNVAACRAMAHRRYAKLKDGGSWTAAEWEAIKRRQNYTCLMCRRREPEITLTVDHIVPVSENGPNVASNLQGLCKSCNSKKHRKVIDLRAA